METRKARKVGWIFVFGLISLALAGHPSAFGQGSETLTHTFTFERPVLGEYTHNGATYTTTPDNYSVSWEGYLAPSSAGTYSFQLDADDKAVAAGLV